MASAIAPKLRVQACVIGSGITGLITAKHLRDAGVSSVVLEKAAMIGGIWCSPKMYKAVTIQQHKTEFVLPEKAWPASAPNFPTVQHVRRYIKDFAEEHKLDDMVHTSSPVKSARFNPESKTWHIEAGGDMNIEADWIGVATGNLGTSRQLDSKIFDTFGGRIVPSTEYYHSTPFYGNHVVLIGLGASSVEIAGDLAHRGVQVTLLAREEETSDWILPRHAPDGSPLKLSANGDTSDTFSKRCQAAREAVIGRLGGRTFEDFLPEALVPKGEPLGGRIIVSETFLDALREGLVEVVEGAATRTGHNSIEYTSKNGRGIIKGVHAIIPCIGFESALTGWKTFMSPAPESVDLYQTMFSPDVPQAGLLGVGYGFVSAPTFAYVHSHGFSRAVTGELELPSADAMREWIDQNKETNFLRRTNTFTDNDYFAKVKAYLTGDPSPVEKHEAAHSGAATESKASDNGVLSDVATKLLSDRFVVNNEDDVKETYAKWADTYEDDSFEALRFDSPEQCALHALAHWPRTESGLYQSNVQVLDVGCGTGALGLLLHKLSRQDKGVMSSTLHGFDLTESMLDICRERGLYKGDLHVHSLTEYPWPYESNSMDLVMCNGVLIYVKDSACLNEMIRVLRPGGKAVLMIRVDGYDTYRDKIEELERNQAWRTVDVSETRNNFPAGIKHNKDFKNVLYNIYIFEKSAEDFNQDNPGDIAEPDRLEQRMSG